MNRSKQIVSLTLISFLTLVAVAFIVRAPSNGTPSSPAVENGLQNTSSPSAIENQPPARLTYNCEAGKDVLDLLRKKVDNNLEVKTYSFGAMVEAINGLKGGSDNKYWLYFIDGKAATVSADTYHCQDNESIEWKFTAETGM